MEEDLKVLEEYFNNICFDETNKITADLCTIGIKEIRAIENLIKGYKKLKEGLKYRVNYCGLLERELYGNENIELTKIEQELLEERN